MEIGRLAPRGANELVATRVEDLEVLPLMEDEDTAAVPAARRAEGDGVSAW